MEIDHVVSNTNIIIIIPNDIIIEIFSRIPAKSLLRLRWACKYLFDLITSDDDFIKKQLIFYHHTITTTTNDNDDHDNRIVNNTSFWIFDSHTTVYTMNFMDVVNTMNFRAVDDYRYNYDDYDYNKDDGTVAINMDCYNLPLSNIDNRYDYRFYFFNSCNGLILINLDWNRYNMKEEEQRRIYFLWNPCTTEVRELPQEPPNTYKHVNDTADYNYRILGLGYDHTIDDYKVVRIIFYYPPLADDNAPIDPRNMDIGVYTLRSNSWSTKIVIDSLLIVYLREQIQKPGLLVNGALHFISESGIGTITSFDIIREEFGEIEGPNLEGLLEAEYGSSKRKYVSKPSFKFQLNVLNGCLCLCQTPLHDNYVIWMMKDYGVKDSWTKLFTINMKKTHAPPSYNWKMCWYSSDPFELYYKDGGVLMVFNKNSGGMIIAACDSKNDEPTLVYSIRGRDNYWFVNGTYTESLVSLNSGMYLTLAAGSKTLIFQKQDLLQYEVKLDTGYLVRKDVTRTEWNGKKRGKHA